MKYKKIKIFIKIHHKVVTCLSIHAIAFDFIGWVVLIEKSKWLKCFWNEIKNGSEIKEKKEKKIRKIKVLLKL